MTEVWAAMQAEITAGVAHQPRYSSANAFMQSSRAQHPAGRMAMA
jgi:hypothetical protein